MDQPRKKSPRAPTMALDEALERAIRAYDKERLRPAPTDDVARNIGYKGASSGAALSALASLRYFGLLERPRDGCLAVAKDVEAFQFAPTEAMKKAFLLSFLRRPPLFAELLDKYVHGLPSEADLKDALIQKGFLPNSASIVGDVFRRSVEYSGVFSRASADASHDEHAAADQCAMDEFEEQTVLAVEERVDAYAISPRPVLQSVEMASDEDPLLDKIPVRLPGGRRAWLCIPTPFFAADKVRLKAQIDLLLTDDD